MILILGSKGMLGGQLLKVFGNQAAGWDREDADVTDFESLTKKIVEFKPTAIINCVAYNDVDGAEDKKDLAFKLNSEVPKVLSDIANQLDIPLVHFSTNYVFDGNKGEYSENDQPSPLSAYAQTKFDGEKNIIDICKKYYLIRTAVIFGPKGQSELSKKSFVDLMLELSKTKSQIKAVNDEINSVTYVVDLASQIKLLLSQGFPFGIYHITNSGEASWYDFAKEILSITKKQLELIPVLSSEFPRKAKRPKKAVLINTKLPQLRSWHEALKEFLNNEV